MLKDLETVLAAAAIAAATLVAPACDGGDDGESESSSETDAGCPGTESTAGCPGGTSDAGCPGTESTAGCPGTESTAGCPGTASTAGCAGTESTAGCPGTGSTAGCPGTSAGCPGAAVPPTNAGELLPWLEGGNYADWAAESTVHDQTNGSPHGRVRVFINETLDASLMGGGDSHPVDSAAVKEIYEVDTLIGWAVSVKTDADSGDGSGWYWYEILNDSVIADGNDEPGCYGCHSGIGVDFFSTTYPLQ